MSCIISPNNRTLVLVTEMEAKKRGSFQSPKITKKLTARIIKNPAQFALYDEQSSVYQFDAKKNTIHK